MTKHWAAATLSVLVAAVCITWGPWSTSLVSDKGFLQQLQLKGVSLAESVKWHSAGRNETAEASVFVQRISCKQFSMSVIHQHGVSADICSSAK